MRLGRLRRVTPCLLALATLLACGGDESADVRSETPARAADERASDDGRGDPPGAQRELVEALREAAARVPHPSDGGGRAWLEPGADAVVAVGRPGRFEIVYEVGPLGIATGGTVFLQVSPFWGWSTPQVEMPDAPGFTTIEPIASGESAPGASAIGESEPDANAIARSEPEASPIGDNEPDADAIELEAATIDQQLLAIRVAGRPLVPGDRLRIVYGAGPAGAAVDRFAEHGSRFWIGVDGDGDGERSFLVDSPTVDVAAGPPAQLVVTGPTIARPGETMRIHLAVLDASGSAGTDFTGRVVFDGESDGLELPDAVEFERSDGGVRTIEVVARAPGIHRLHARASDDLAATSNPIVVSEIGPRVLWGDLHGHSKLSDGTGTVDDYFHYARDVAGLDVAALSDHDHWGMLPLDEHPEMWREIREGAMRAHEPGRFVSLLAYEWTSWIHGHRHVVYFEDVGEVYSSISTEYESPPQLWAALAGQSALTFAHHSAGGPIPTNWDFPPDPVLEPVTEIASVHGSSEAPDSPYPIYDSVRGNFVRDALERGYKLGFVGSGDSHDGHPGLAHLASGMSGIAAILSEDRTREGVLAALRERRVYATNGPRILLRTAFGSHGMGMTAPVPAPDAAGPPDELFVHVVAVTPLERIDIIRSGEPVHSIPAEGRLEVAVQVTLDDLHAGDFVYVRAVQEDQGAAWSSPIFFE